MYLSNSQDREPAFRRAFEHTCGYRRYRRDHFVKLNRYAWMALRFFSGGLLLDAHVLEFARFKDLTAFFAFHKFTVFFASDDLYA